MNIFIGAERHGSAWVSASMLGFRAMSRGLGDLQRRIKLAMNTAATEGAQHMLLADLYWIFEMAALLRGLV